MLLELTATVGAIAFGIRCAKKKYGKRSRAIPQKDSGMAQDKSSHLSIERQIVQGTQTVADSAALTGGANRKSPLEKRLDQNLLIAVSSLGIAMVGGIAYAPIKLLSLPGFFYIAKENLADAYIAARHGRIASTQGLSALVKILLFCNGQFVLCNLSACVYAVNRKLLHSVKDNSRKKIVDVFRQNPRSSFILSNGVEIEVPFEALKSGDVAVVNAGETIPADGRIVDGYGSIDQHILTGEAQPVDKTRGDTVFASTTVLAGRICVQVDKAGEQTTAAQIGKLLNQTVDVKTGMQLWAESVTDRTVLPTLLIGAAASPIIGPMGATAFLYSHPRFKTTVAGSIGVLNAFDFTSKRGILVKDGRTFDLLNQVDTIVFDKTGTLTQEQPHVQHIHALRGFNETTVLCYAAEGEYRQTHPIARAILQEAGERGLNIRAIDEAEYKVGYGVAATIEGQTIRVGSLRFMAMEGIRVAPEIEAIQARCHLEGHTLVLVALDQKAIGAVELHATIRPEAKAIIRQLRQRNIDAMYVISGDHEAPTRRLAEELGIEHYFAETLPEQKALLIDRIQSTGKSVCYIGDGINDAIALKKAKVSISLKGASSLAMDTAQVILMDQSLRQLDTLFELADKFHANQKKTVAYVFIPHVISLGGSLLLDFDFIMAFILTQIGLFGGVANAATPLIKDAESGKRSALKKE